MEDMERLVGVKTDKGDFLHLVGMDPEDLVAREHLVALVALGLLGVQVHLNHYSVKMEMNPVEAEVVEKIQGVADVQLRL